MNRRGWNEGATAVETAVSLLALIMVVLGIIQLGIAFYNMNTMQLVVEEAGRYAMVNYPGTNTAAACSTASTGVANQANNVILKSIPVVGASVTTSCVSGSPMLMTITGSFSTLDLLFSIPALTTRITVPLS